MPQLCSTNQILCVLLLENRKLVPNYRYGTSSTVAIKACMYGRYV